MNNLFTYKGRMRRRDYLIINLIIGIPLLLISQLDVNTDYVNDNIIEILILFALISSFSLLQGIKRFHDIEYSGWFYLLLLIPIINIGGAFLLTFKDGTNGPNKYGDDPKGRKPQIV